MLGARETARSTASVNGRSKKIAPTKSVDEANFHRVNVALQLLPEALNITKPNADVFNSLNVAGYIKYGLDNGTCRKGEAL